MIIVVKSWSDHLCLVTSRVSIFDFVDIVDGLVLFGLGGLA